MPIIKTAGIVSKPNSTAAEEIVPKLIEWLRRRGIAVRIDEQTAVYANGVTGMPRMNYRLGRHYCAIYALRRTPKSANVRFSSGEGQ